MMECLYAIILVALSDVGVLRTKSVVISAVPFNATHSSVTCGLAAKIVPQIELSATVPL